ncbi:MAG TPA: hypothetical protein PKJ47_11165 [Candidatus Limiplasma sp.]|nr:hypothetical protein [Candidatus Limiplasma sp.]
MKTKQQYETERKELMKRVQDIDAQLAQIGNNTLKLKDKDLPFVKWSIEELQNLNNISETAYNWFRDNRLD